MTPKHHLSDATLAAFSAGTLGESLSLVVASHLSTCRPCRQRSTQFEDVGGAELSTAQPVEMSQDALNRVLIQLGQQEPPTVVAPDNLIRRHVGVSASSKDRAGFVPKPLQAFVPANLDDVEWSTMAPGIKCFELAGVKTGGGTLSLLKIAPGVTIPEHSHKGTELTLVLSGSYSDEIGRFGVGDIADLDEDTEHQPIADSSEACICLIATEAPLRFTKLMPRIVQYFAGI